MKNKKYVNNSIATCEYSLGTFGRFAYQSTYYLRKSAPIHFIASCHGILKAKNKCGDLRNITYRIRINPEVRRIQVLNPSSSATQRLMKTGNCKHLLSQVRNKFIKYLEVL